MKKIVPGEKGHPEGFRAVRRGLLRPLPPWTVRRLVCLREIERRHPMPINRKYCRRTYGAEQEAKDIRRLIEEGYVEVTGKPADLRRKKVEGLTPAGERKPIRVRYPAYRYLRLTEKGRALIAPTPPPEPTGGPYARRRAALAEFKEAQL